MIPRSWSRANPVVVVLGAAGAVAAAAPGFGQCCYSVAQFPSPINCPWPWGPDIPTPEALNDLGIWVGHVDQCPENDNWDYGLRWSPAEGWTVLPFQPGAISAQAFGINDAGVTVGMVAYPAAPFESACIWTDSGMIVLPPPEGSNKCWAEDVNSSMQVVGARGGMSSGYHPFVWENGQFIDIPLSGFSRGVARVINDEGVVAGVLESPLFRAFRWTAGDLEILEPLPGAPRSLAYSISARGWVVGNSNYIPSTVQLPIPTYWPAHEPVALPPLAGFQGGWLHDCNTKGVFVGASMHAFPNPFYNGTVWFHGVPYRLKDLPPGFNTGLPRAINDAGQILASGPISGGLPGVYLLTPIAPPACDITGDCRVDGHDLATLLTEWGTRGIVADLNGDRTVDGADLGLLLGDWTG